MEQKCQDCDATMKILDDVVVGEIISCPDCGNEFEVSKIDSNSVTLSPAESVGEDWGE
ncbi:MAG: lysine biosynthesis protein LysW [Nitrososphaerales archaeon]|nr:lysine biosynthesis protein LysW [Nitrososphaerales archaeon]|tara:strand:+ start:811 stop:984 length:174 start_codon:yes stop_codon:yes gene_type:complete